MLHILLNNNHFTSFAAELVSRAVAVIAAIATCVLQSASDVRFTGIAKNGESILQRRWKLPSSTRRGPPFLLCILAHVLAPS